MPINYIGKRITWKKEVVRCGQYFVELDAHVHYYDTVTLPGVLGGTIQKIVKLWTRKFRNNQAKPELNPVGMVFRVKDDQGMMHLVPLNCAHFDLSYPENSK